MSFEPKFREVVPADKLPTKETLAGEDWGRTRWRWNNEGHCARKACGRPHDNRIHQHSGLAYCPGCQSSINYYNPEVPNLVETKTLADIA